MIPPRQNLFLTLVALIGVGMLALLPCRAEISSSKAIKVPYGVAWGASMENVRDMIRAVKGTESGFTQKTGGRTVLEATGLNVGDQLLRKSLFIFRNGLLAEVELEYGDPSWDAEKTTDFFDRTRRRIDERYGTGTLLVNKIKEQPSDAKAPSDVTFTLIIYQWIQPTIALELNYSSVEGNEKAVRVVSLHYKTP